MMQLLESILYLGVLAACPSFSSAWSSAGGGNGSSSVDRRKFLHKAAVLGTAATTASVFAESAEATSLYQPPPGSLAGQVHVITGASSGLGLESSKRLAAAGATVVMTARTAAKAEMAKSQVETYLSERSITNQDDNIHALTLDFDNLDNARSFPERFSQELGSNRKIDVLMNNAGRINQKREITKDGFETTLQSNHLGGFVLTAGLFPKLNRNGARIINVSSSAHQFAKVVSTGKQGLDMSNLNGELSYGSDGWEAYGNTKLENIFFTQELQRRANAAGLTWLTAVSLHPGVVGTDIWKNSSLAKSNTGELSLQSIISDLFYKNILSNEERANTQVMLASTDSQKISKGRFYNELGRVVDLSPFAVDQSKAEELWEVSEKLISCKFVVV